MKIICTICARKNSTGIKNKSIKILGDMPLIAHTITQAKQAKIFDKIIVSTDSKVIQKVAIKYGADSWFLRPKKLATKISSKEAAIRHALIEAEKHYKKKFDICVDLDLTAPLRNINDILSALNLFKKTNSSILFSVSKSKKNPYFNMVEIENKKVKLVKRPRTMIFSRQKTPKVFDMNASIYIWKREKIMKSNNLFGAKTSIYVMPPERSIDIDEELDFKVVKMLYKK